MDSGGETGGAGHSQRGIPDTESLQIATIKARLPGDIGTLGQRHHGHIGDNVWAGAWGGGIEWMGEKAGQVKSWGGGGSQGL